MWLHVKIIAEVLDVVFSPVAFATWAAAHQQRVRAQVLQFCKGLFPSVRYGFTTIPTYPSGQIGFVVCGKSAKAKLNKPKRTVKAALGKKLAKVRTSARPHSVACG